MEHPITPPPTELVQQWFLAARAMPVNQWVTDVATAAAQWGWEQRGAANEAELQQRADQELEACVEWTQSYAECGDSLRAARRPTPPSLKEQALLQLDEISTCFRISHGGPIVCDKIRQALEALPND